MPSAQEIRQGQELIRSLASDQDASRGWNEKLQPTGVIDENTIAATQVLLYLGEKRKPLPDSLHTILQPGTQTLWRTTLTSNWSALVSYLKATFPRGFTQAAAIGIGMTIAIAASFLLGIRALARWEDARSDHGG